MMQRISGAVYNWSFSDQFISESTNQRINETGNVHESRHCGIVLAAIQRFWVVGRGSSIRLFAFCIAVAMFFIVYFAKTGGFCHGREMSGLLCDRRGAVEV
ncbi:MAG: hypothetical protein F4X51_12150 [Gemmatimonadetes bacterium]|nr:hypothetical protein [Gemmatimonadota bacterium]